MKHLGNEQILAIGIATILALYASGIAMSALTTTPAFAATSGNGKSSPDKSSPDKSSSSSSSGNSGSSGSGDKSSNNS